MTASTIQIGEIHIEVIRKNIKNVHLSVYPPNGTVRIAAPQRMKIDTIRVFAISKLGWIKLQQKKICAQERETPREYVEKESHTLWGKHFLLRVVDADGVPSIEISHNSLVLHINPKASDLKKEAIVEAWYRTQLRNAVAPLIAKWEPVLGIKVERIFVQKMKTRWGSCNFKTSTVRFNTDLAKKPPECLEYVLVHELAHLLEPTHNERFVAVMDRFLPHWRQRRDQLNQLPLRHESWKY